MRGVFFGPIGGGVLDTPEVPRVLHFHAQEPGSIVFIKGNNVVDASVGGLFVGGDLKLDTGSCRETPGRDDPAAVSVDCYRGAVFGKLDLGVKAGDTQRDFQR